MRIPVSIGNGAGRDFGLTVAIVAFAAIAGLVSCTEFAEPSSPGTEHGLAEIVGDGGGSPYVVEGNPTCGDIDSSLFELKIDPPSSGTYQIGPVPGFDITISTSEGNYFDWTSDLGVDLVVVKGGPAANVYEYDPESFGDIGLHAPVNSSGGPAGLSHISFCLDFELFISKTAETSYTRTFEWSLDKTASVESLLLAPGEPFTVLYQVAADVDFTDSAFLVEGEVEIVNPAPLTAIIESIEDLMCGIPVEVSCPKSVLEPGETMVCTYEQALDEAMSCTNTVTVETCGPVEGGEASAEVVFGEPSEVIDECLAIEDSLVGPLETLCIGGTMTLQYEYTIEEPTCDLAFEVENVVTGTANDSAAVAWDQVVIAVQIAACEEGCTLTYGYWKTHSEFGPAPYDDTWATLGEGASTPFFSTGLSYHEILWTAPKGGNAYLLLAHQWIAAGLNAANGASVPPEVQDALDEGAALLDAYADCMGCGLKGKNAEAVRSEFLSLAALLAHYNEGMIGPGHCDE